VVAHFAELHENVSNSLIYARCQVIACLGVHHELIIEEPLTFGEQTEHEVLKFSRKLLLHIVLEVPEQVRT